ncbi:MAG: hypothetical protein HLUCCA12_13870 [Rhodobacteraceae bacterium HLUCCA12]|nr:MAG: hypothetical protein HLUCCA12_13870 [Rhodobacteraceae bacterium HLUCCA12]
MHRELAAYQRLLIITYRRYLEADRALASRLDALRAVFPPDRKPHRGTIGAPDSPIRRLCENRDRALLRLHAARAEFEAARARIAQRHARPTNVLFLRVHSPVSE